MLTAMTDEDWTIVLQVFAASRLRRGDKGRGVEPICRVLKIAPSTYHAHDARRRRTRRSRAGAQPPSS